MSLTTIMAIEKNVSYAEQAYTELKRLIIFCELPAETILNERDVSKRLGISRTPVRDALQMLETKGWLERRGKNKIVSPITEKNIREIFELRKVLERLTVDLAKDKITKRDLDYYNYLITQFEDVRDKAISCTQDPSVSIIEILELDKTFHLYMGKICGNDMLYNTMDELFEQFVRIHITTFHDIFSRMDFLVAGHRKMNECLQNHNFEAYKELISAHFTSWPNSWV